MSRTLEARLKRIEGEIGTTGDATALYEEMLRSTRAALQGKVENPDTPTPERDEAQAKLACLNAEQWSRYGGAQKFNIIDALHEARMSDGCLIRNIREHDYNPDWAEVAAELGLKVPNRENETIRLITHIIVSPPPRDTQAVTLQ